MKYLVLIQARCGSSRLPNKIMTDLCGKPTLQRMVERVQKSRYVDEVMVITSIEKENLQILELCAKMGVRCFVGSEKDVLDRYYQAAKLLQPEYVIRLTADCPCFDAGLLDEAIEQLKPETDYMSMMSETFADGLDLEIMRFSALRTAWKSANRAFEREHVTQYIIRRPEQFKQQDFLSPVGNFGEKRWTIDEPEDLELVQKIYQHFVVELGNEFFTYRELLAYLKEHPELEKINAKFARNEGLAKSIAEDYTVNFDE